MDGNSDNGIDEDCSGLALFAKTKLFPNPTSDILTVHLDRIGLINIRIYDLSGRLVYRAEEALEDNRFFIDMSSLRNGLYMLRLETVNGEEILVQKVTKM